MKAGFDEDGWSPQGPVTELSEHHAWDFLRRSSIGRLAVSVDNKPAIFPVDFYCDGESILFRTSKGTKLSDLIANDAVAFEADEHSIRESVSVIVEGHARIITDEAETLRADKSSLPPWIPIAVPVYVRILPTAIHGRRFTRAIIKAHVG
jgi:general stress protein 26